jgi:hypothetical protein
VLKQSPERAVHEGRELDASGSGEINSPDAPQERRVENPWDQGVTPVASKWGRVGARASMPRLQRVTGIGGSPHSRFCPKEAMCRPPAPKAPQGNKRCAALDEADAIATTTAWKDNVPSTCLCIYYVHLASRMCVRAACFPLLQYNVIAAL